MNKLVYKKYKGEISNDKETLEYDGWAFSRVDFSQSMIDSYKGSAEIIATRCEELESTKTLDMVVGNTYTPLEAEREGNSREVTLVKIIKDNYLFATKDNPNVKRVISKKSLGNYLKRI